MIREDNLYLAEQLIELIKSGADNWEMPWHKGFREPINAFSNLPFVGENAFILWAEGAKRGCGSIYWATLKQWSKLGGRLRKGSKGVKVYRPAFTVQKYTDGTSKDNFVGFRSYTVFNYEDVNNLDWEHPDLFGKALLQSFSFNENAEQLIKKSEAEVFHVGDSAYYEPSTDRIFMPLRSSFLATKHSSASENYYATLIHELVHWTKDENRVNRPDEFPGDSQRSYAFEELVAELGASILTTRFHGLPSPREDHAEYLSSWLSILENDFSLFYKAFTYAQKASDWLCQKANITLCEGEWQVSVDETASPSLKPKRVFAIYMEKVGGLEGVRFNSLLVGCGCCHGEFKVTLANDEKGARCPECFSWNEQANHIET